MLGRWITYQERRRLARDTNRRALPFEWGVEFIEPRNGSQDPHRIFDEYVDWAMQHSDAFFQHTPTTDYHFDGHQLTYPSQIQTPYPENNTVYARYYPAKQWLSQGKIRPAVIVMPQWNGDYSAHVALAQLFARFGISALRLSMPYHDLRKPPQLERSDYMVSSNIGRTIQASRQAVLDVRRGADWLLHRGFNRIAVMGTSIGSSVAFLTFAHDERFGAGIFNHGSSFFGDVVWTGITTQHVRQGIETHLTQEQLRRYLSPISPFPFIRRLQSNPRKMLIVSAKYDLSFLPCFSEDVFREYKARHIPFDLQLMPCGHYTLGTFPFNWWVASRMIRFLRKHLFSAPAAGKNAPSSLCR